MSRTKDPKRLVAKILGSTKARVAGESAEPLAPAAESTPAAEATPAAESTLAAEATSLAPEQAQSSASPVASGMSDEDVADLIEVYFSLEEPAERDVTFDKLAAVDTEATSDFFLAMMTHDEDDYMRRAAAAELARRGHPDALKSLKEDLAVDADALAFEHALETLAQIQAKKFVPVVALMWKDTSRNSLQRRAAMSVYEVLDAPRALAAFVDFVDGIADVKNFADDILEQAMAAFGRNDYRAAVPALQRLQSRMASAAWDDAGEKQENIDFVGEGLALLKD